MVFMIPPGYARIIVDQGFSRPDQRCSGLLGGAARHAKDTTRQSCGSTQTSASPEGILVWELDPAVHARAACEIAGRELTEVEWRTYFGDDPQVETCRQLIP
jgi:hypothetical protein